MKTDEEILACVQNIVPTMYGGMQPRAVTILARPNEKSRYYIVEKDFTPCFVTIYLEEDTLHNLTLHHSQWEVIGVRDPT
jgi:hypothetical protein